MNKDPYQWTVRDKLLYWLSMIPFLVAFVGTFLLLKSYSVWLSVLLLLFYLLINIFQAGCCIDCPYRGLYCPAIFGIYFSNILSGFLYPNRKFDQIFFDRNAVAGESMVLIVVLFPIYWIFNSGWYLMPIYLLLIAAHLIMFMPTQCEKCSYNETCPGGITWRVCKSWLNRLVGELLRYCIKKERPTGSPFYISEFVISVRVSALRNALSRIYRDRKNATNAPIQGWLPLQTDQKELREPI